MRVRFGLRGFLRHRNGFGLLRGKPFGVGFAGDVGDLACLRGCGSGGVSRCGGSGRRGLRSRGVGRGMRGRLVGMSASPWSNWHTGMSGSVATAERTDAGAMTACS